LPSISSLLMKIPDEFKPWAAIGIGALILVILVLFHGAGLHLILSHFKRVELRLRLCRPHLGRAGFLFGWAVFMMLSLHICEIVFWAYGLIALGLIVRQADAIYFCANAYTTVGWGAVDLGVNWRNISPIIAISGLFTFAWTASSLVSIVANYLKLVEQLEVERLEQLNLRAAARIAERHVLTKEKAAEQVVRSDAGKHARDVSLLKRWRMRREARQEAKLIRNAARAEIAQIRQKESFDEDQLGQEESQKDSEAKT
jgi:hypothetical protein